jgi:AraC-like DNA-binding protein
MVWSRVLDFDDPLSYAAALQTVTTKVLPTAKGGFKGELTQIRMKRLWMQRFEVNLPQITAGTLSEPRRVFAFLSEPTSGKLHYNGLNIHPGDITGGFDVYHVRSEAHLRLASLSLPSDDLPAICRTLLGNELLNVSSRLRPAPDLMSRLSLLHKAIGRLAHDAPDVLHTPEVGRALEDEITHVLVRCLAEGVGFKPTSSINRHAVLMARFEEFLEANPGKPLYLTEICAAIGTAERTLRAACEEHLGMGPIRFLTLRRMYLVRDALSRADPRTDTVTRIVTDHGFWELGRFSVAYRARFGETPSITMKRLATHAATKLNRPSALQEN